MKTITKSYPTRAYINSSKPVNLTFGTVTKEKKCTSNNNEQEELFECELKKNRLILNKISTPLLDIKISNKMGQTLDEYHLQDTKYAQINLGKYLSDIISITMNIGNTIVKSFEHTRV